jgi:hypothetical protein
VKRPHISTATKVNVAIEQAGGWIRCALCSGPLRPSEPRILEHLVPHELDGSSDAENLRWVHKECAGKKTNGSRATSAGGDIHKIAKVKRLLKKHSNPTPEGTMKSRGFEGSRKFNGKINWRESK